MISRTEHRKSMLVIAGALVLAMVGIAWAEDLPNDPSIERGVLANGVKWMYRQHSNPPGKMIVWIHVATGSLNETESQRGLAHFLEHMSFNGSEHFPPGKLIEYLESLGMHFGPDVNAHTGVDETVYKLSLPDTTTDQAERALTVLSDCAFRLLLLPEEIDKERGVILSELRAGMSAEQRLRDQFFEQVFAGTHLSQRLPIGLETVIRNATRTDFEDYYRAWYRPERITLMMVGDAPREQYMPLIEKWFGQYRAELPARPQQKAGLVPLDQTRAIVLSDEEYAAGDVAMYRIAPGRGSARTVAESRVELIDHIGSWLIGRRYSERVKSGLATYRTAGAGVTDLLNEATLVGASAAGAPEDWEQMLEELVVEVRRASEHGFTESELELARKDLLAAAERAVRAAPTRDARELIMELSQSVNSEAVLMSAEQELELVQRLLPGITLDDVNQAFSQHFDAGHFAYVLTMPESEDVKLPASDEVLAAARAAQALRVEPYEEIDRPDDLLEAEPAPGAVVEQAVDEDLGITSAWLSNGVRVHHRFVDYRQDMVMIGITLAGGEIEETAENAGVTNVAALIFNQPATGRLSSARVEDLMTGESISVSGEAQGDTFMFVVAGSVTDVESGMRLAHALLKDARIEQSVFDNWRQGAHQEYAMALKQPQFGAFRAFFKEISGADPRRRMMLTDEQIDSQTLERGQAWLDRLLQTAPIEVAIVGDITWDDARPLIEKYVGSLATRPRQATNLGPLRKLKRVAGPLERNVSVETITPQAWVVYGFMGAPSQNVNEARALAMAASILDTRLVKRVREELGLVYSMSAAHVPVPAYEDSSFFFTHAPCAPEQADEVVRETVALFETFAESGPTETELDNTRKRIANILDKQLEEPSYWFDKLATFDLHHRSLEEMKNIRAAYANMSAEDLRKAFVKYYVPERIFRVVARPEQAAPVPAGSGAGSGE